MIEKQRQAIGYLDLLLAFVGTGLPKEPFRVYIFQYQLTSVRHKQRYLHYAAASEQHIG